jgi:hypothetical protein
MFPGTVRFIMEAAAAPFITDPTWVVLEEEPFSYGFTPDDWSLPEELGERVDALRQAAAKRFGTISIPLAPAAGRPSAL